MKMIGPSADALLKMCVIANSDEEKEELESKGQVDPKALEASPLDKHYSSMNQNRYTLEVGVDPNLEYDITGVSIATGFKSLSAFSTNFKSLYGLSPTEWVKKMEEEG